MSRFSLLSLTLFVCAAATLAQQQTYCNGQSYYDANTGAAGCCTTGVTWVNARAGTGYCGGGGGNGGNGGNSGNGGDGGGGGAWGNGGNGGNTGNGGNGGPGGWGNGGNGGNSGNGGNGGPGGWGNGGNGGTSGNGGNGGPAGWGNGGNGGNSGNGGNGGPGGWGNGGNGGNSGNGGNGGPGGLGNGGNGGNSGNGGNGGHGGLGGNGWGACGLNTSCTCANNPVCGKGNSLGIKYGHCYIISFGDGQQLGAVRESTQYQKGGFFTDIPFKVCASTSNCAPGGFVQRGQPFSLQDQHGLYNDPKSTKGWIDDSVGGGHLAFTLDPTHAGKFSGIPTCTDGECAILIHGEPSGGGLGFACPATQPGITIWGNPKTTQKLRFSEVTCDDYEVPLTSNIDPANAAYYQY